MIIVTGAAGFIGSCLVKKLNSENFNVLFFAPGRIIELMGSVEMFFSANVNGHNKNEFTNIRQSRQPSFIKYYVHPDSKKS